MAEVAAGRRGQAAATALVGLVLLGGSAGVSLLQSGRPFPPMPAAAAGST
jgi:hypothetical protein